jgi:hypothetical protein
MGGNCFTGESIDPMDSGNDNSYYRPKDAKQTGCGNGNKKTNAAKYQAGKKTDC